MELKPIARIRTGFSEKFGIPRQAGLAPDALGRIVFEEGFRDPAAVRGLEEFSHLWLIWDFSENHRESVSLTARPPRLGGQTRLGVFATRSPFRPNPLGLSCVRLLGLVREKEGIELEVGGVDMLDNTPIYDIKPYLAYSDAHPEARGGFTDRTRMGELEVLIPEEQSRGLSPRTLLGIEEILRADPRTAYLHDEERLWGLSYEGMNIRFIVRGNRLEVKEIRQCSGEMSSSGREN